ncbi:hypothetical protein GCM10010503_14750 [Streptomyces lucensis JCM 4490]|uniref:Uncharacterized protein n=1 Tax=Streptomyces lucensis JCM 4490 TaxID=1306176 RepID=A0A918IYV7_9ACTN|nr:hypothetical protein [Streptomyces lucensis]GGW39503.1 hypothetical protein GCM10010503_14750 [Streptomyces lucensis JCM 4490]
MSADREKHDMTQTDIALLLADAADEVEIGIAPVQAVIRGGRRRRARRWAVAAATTMVLAGSTGATLAVTGLPGDGQQDRGTSVAAEARHVDRPHLTELAGGTDQGQRWRVELSVWDAPRDKAEVTRQLEAMRRYGIDADALPERSHLVGKTSHFASLYYGDRGGRVLLFDTAQEWNRMTGKDIEFGALPLTKGGADRADRLVVGQVAATARQVECTWEGGTGSVVRPRAAAGSPVKWFVCLGPAGKANKSAWVMD